MVPRNVKTGSDQPGVEEGKSRQEIGDPWLSLSQHLESFDQLLLTDVNTITSSALEGIVQQATSLKEAMVSDYESVIAGYYGWWVGRIEALNQGHSCFQNARPEVVIPMEVKNAEQPASFVEAPTAIESNFLRAEEKVKEFESSFATDLVAARENFFGPKREQLQTLFARLQSLGSSRHISLDELSEAQGLYNSCRDKTNDQTGNCDPQLASELQSLDAMLIELEGHHSKREDEARRLTEDLQVTRSNFPFF